MVQATFTDVSTALLADISRRPFSTNFAHSRGHMAHLIQYWITRESNIKARARIISTMDNIRSTLTVSLSVPKMIGIGPIIIKPPPLALPRMRMLLANNEGTMAKVIMKPAKIDINPNVARVI